MFELHTAAFTGGEGEFETAWACLSCNAYTRSESHFLVTAWACLSCNLWIVNPEAQFPWACLSCNEVAILP